MSRWGHEHNIGAGTPKVGKEATGDEKLNSEGNTENTARWTGRMLLGDLLGVNQIDGRKAIWVWTVLARNTVWDFVTLVLFLWHGRNWLPSVKLFLGSEAEKHFSSALSSEKKPWVKGCSSSGHFLWKCSTVRITGRWFMSSWILQLSLKYRGLPAEHHTNTEHLGKLLVFHYFSSSSVSGYISPSTSIKDKARVTALESGQHPRGECQRWRVEKIWAKKWGKFRKCLF